jgi:hypothetical protein
VVVVVGAAVVLVEELDPASVDCDAVRPADALDPMTARPPTAMRATSARRRAYSTALAPRS